MPQHNHYDVIIIGTGAGGGTLAYRLAPSGKRILILERGDYVAREKDNWSTRAVNVSAKYKTKEQWLRHRRASRSTRTPTTMSAATPSSMARRCSACGARTSARCGMPAAFRRPGRSPTTISSPTTPRPNISTRCTASAAQIRPSRRPARRTRIRRSVTSRASSSCTTISRASATGRSTCRSASCSTRRSRDQPLHPLRHLRRPPVPGPRQVRRRRSSASIPRSQHPNVSLLTNAYVSRLETTPSGREVTKVVVERNGAVERYSADIVVSPAARSTPPRCCCARRTTGIRTARQWLRRRRPPLHGPRQLGADGALEVPEPDGVSEDAGAERLLLRLDDLAVSRWATSRLSASSTR